MNNRHVTSLWSRPVRQLSCCSAVCGSDWSSFRTMPTQHVRPSISFPSTVSERSTPALFSGAVTEAGGGSVARADHCLLRLLVALMIPRAGIHNEVLAEHHLQRQCQRITSSRLRRDGSSPTARRSPLIHSLMPGTTPSPTVPTKQGSSSSSAPFRVLTICRSRIVDPSATLSGLKVVDDYTIGCKLSFSH